MDSELSVPTTAEEGSGHLADNTALGAGNIDGLNLSTSAKGGRINGPLKSSPYVTSSGVTGGIPFMTLSPPQQTTSLGKGNPNTTLTGMALQQAQNRMAPKKSSFSMAQQALSRLRPTASSSAAGPSTAAAYQYNSSLGFAAPVNGGPSEIASDGGQGSTDLDLPRQSSPGQMYRALADDVELSTLSSIGSSSSSGKASTLSVTQRLSPSIPSATVSTQRSPVLQDLSLQQEADFGVVARPPAQKQSPLLGERSLGTDGIMPANDRRHQFSSSQGQQWLQSELDQRFSTLLIASSATVAQQQAAQSAGVGVPILDQRRSDNLRYNESGYGRIGDSTYDTVAVNPNMSYIQDDFQQQQLQYMSSPINLIANPDGNLYKVQFKRSYRTFVRGSTVDQVLREGDFVIVEADRGTDLGIIVEIQPIPYYVRDGSIAMPWGDKSDSGSKLILRHAMPTECAALPEKYSLEQQVVMSCIERALGNYLLPMTVLDAEYQFDRHKLTIYYESNRRIDFRELVRDLFAVYKTRIWMEVVNYSFRPNEAASMALISGLPYNSFSTSSASLQSLGTTPLGVTNAGHYLGRSRSSSGANVIPTGYGVSQLNSGREVHSGVTTLSSSLSSGSSPRMRNSSLPSPMQSAQSMPHGHPLPQQAYTLNRGADALGTPMSASSQSDMSSYHSSPRTAMRSNFSSPVISDSQQRISPRLQYASMSLDSLGPIPPPPHNGYSVGMGYTGQQGGPSQILNNGQFSALGMSARSGASSVTGGSGGIGVPMVSRNHQHQDPQLNYQNRQYY